MKTKTDIKKAIIYWVLVAALGGVLIFGYFYFGFGHKETVKLPQATPENPGVSDGGISSEEIINGLTGSTTEATTAPLPEEMDNISVPDNKTATTPLPPGALNDLTSPTN